VVRKAARKHRARFARLLRTGKDPIRTLCQILEDDGAPVEERKEAARALGEEAIRVLRFYYHPLFDRICPLLERFRPAELGITLGPRNLQSDDTSRL